MLMVPNIRRAVILLDAIPLDQRQEIVLHDNVDHTPALGGPGFECTLLEIRSEPDHVYG